MSAKFIAEEGPLTGLELSLEKGEEWIIGRDPDSCQLVIETPSISRTHLICRNTPEGFTLENLSITNPTLINNEELQGPHLLQDGDLVKIGDELFCFYLNGNEKVSKDDDTAPVVSQILETDKPEEISDNMDQTQNNPFGELSQEATRDSKDQDLHQNSVFDEDSNEKLDVAKITFSPLDTGKWLLKVISGPNNGAEFSLQTDSSYLIGTDPNVCDLVFHDTSVSRQHVRISITANDLITIEDLQSRNGTNVDGIRLEEKQTIAPNTIISIGTSSFVIYDREGEMHTIISPLLPSIVKQIIEEKTPEQKPVNQVPVETVDKESDKEPISPQETTQHHMVTLGALILIGILLGIFVVVGVGISTLFKAEPVTTTETVDPTQSLNTAILPFAPNVKYTFNNNTGQLLIVGHVLTASDRAQLLYSLQGLRFIKNLDDTGLIIDEGVWREMNQVIEKNPEWKGINISSPAPGRFIISGYLKKRTQADTLSEYLSANFPYPDLLEKRIVVDEEVTSSISSLLQNRGYKSVIVALDNGEISLTGLIPNGKSQEFASLIPQIKEIRGVRNVRNLTNETGRDEAIINISDKYEVTGSSNQGGRFSVIINGRILMPGDTLDNMTITSIRGNSIILERDGSRYRIDFNK